MAEIEAAREELKAMVKRLLVNDGDFIGNYKLHPDDLRFLRNMQTWQGEYKVSQMREIEDIYYRHF